MSWFSDKPKEPGTKDDSLKPGETVRHKLTGSRMLWLGWRPFGLTGDGWYECRKEDGTKVEIDPCEVERAQAEASR